MYSVGLITLAFSAARIHAVINDNLSTKEWLLSQFNFVTWGTIEAFTAIVCVNIPCLVAGFNKWHNRTSSSSSSSSSPFSSSSSSLPCSSSKVHRPDFNRDRGRFHRPHLQLTKNPTSHIYEYRLRSPSTIQSAAFCDAAPHGGLNSNATCITVTQEFTADIELNQHTSSGDYGTACRFRPTDLA